MKYKIKIIALFLIALIAFNINPGMSYARSVKAKAHTTENNTFAQKGNKFLSDPRWRPGTTFNGKQKPKLSKYNCVGCCAYAADFVKYVFGKDSPRAGVLYKNINQIRKGDLIVVTSPSHWIIVVGRKGNSLNTIEGNWLNGKVDRSNGAYTIKNGKLLRNDKPFRNFAYGYHFL